MDALQIKHIDKKFGRQIILNDLNFVVSEHTVFGFIGKNGAGKTTLMKLILGYLKADAGEIIVCGEKAGFSHTRTNRLIGYLPDVPVFYGYMNAVEYLTFCGRIAGLKAAAIRKRNSELLGMVELSGIKKSIRGYSRGMKQRLGIAAALLTRPKLLICDEATSALDPQGRKDILDLLALVRRETTVLFSTHILSDVDRICDQIGLLHNGKIVLQGRTSEIEQQHGGDTLQIGVFTHDDALRLAAALKKLPFIISTEIAESTCTFRISDVRHHALDIIDILVKEKIALNTYHQLEPTLENVFLEMVK